MLVVVQSGAVCAEQDGDGGGVAHAKQLRCNSSKQAEGRRERGSDKLGHVATATGKSCGTNGSFEKTSNLKNNDDTNKKQR